MELAHFNNQTSIDSIEDFNIIQQQQIINNQQAQVSQVTLNRAQLYHDQQQLQLQKDIRYANNLETIKRYELPVDVPSSFSGIAKHTPRYPPPKPHRQVSQTVSPNINPSTLNQNHPSLPYSAYNNRAHLSNNQPLAQDNVANIFIHNTSLRSSIKLRQLEFSRNRNHSNYPVGQMQPSHNQAFELNEDEFVPDLNSVYNRIQDKLNEKLVDAKLAKLLTHYLSIYNTIVKTRNKKCLIPNLTSRHAIAVDGQGNEKSVVYRVSDLLQSVISSVQMQEMSKELAELLAILIKYEIHGVCSAYDRIVQNFEFCDSSRPTSPTVPVEVVQENGPQTELHSCKQIDRIRSQSFNQVEEFENFQLDQIRTIQIDKDFNQLLGLTIKNDLDGNIIVGRLVYGGAAYRSGLIHKDDTILKINGCNMQDLDINEVVNILEDMNGPILLTISSKHFDKTSRLQEKIFVRTLFKYDGESDYLNPCKELGLSFDKGEILAVVDQSDPRWWQAHKRNGEWQLAGLIPSQEYLKQREKESKNYQEFELEYIKQGRKTLVSAMSNCIKGTFDCLKGTSPRREKSFQTETPLEYYELSYYKQVWLN